jgi:hypothetical protein
MWSNDEVVRLALEAACLLFGTIVASLIAKRKGVGLGALTGFVGGCVLWLLMFAVQLRGFANWQ